MFPNQDVDTRHHINGCALSNQSIIRFHHENQPLNTEVLDVQDIFVITAHAHCRWNVPNVTHHKHMILIFLVIVTVGDVIVDQLAITTFPHNGVAVIAACNVEYALVWLFNCAVALFPFIGSRYAVFTQYSHVDTWLSIFLQINELPSYQI